MMNYLARTAFVPKLESRILAFSISLHDAFGIPAVGPAAKVEADERLRDFDARQKNRTGREDRRGEVYFRALKSELSVPSRSVFDYV